MRTPDARLVWYAPIGSRSKTALAGLGVLEDYTTGYLVRDDHASYYQLAGVQQCTGAPHTLADYCRTRPYLITTRNHNIRPIDAALTSNPWFPAISTA